jgi:hypothetical protein
MPAQPAGRPAGPGTFGVATNLLGVAIQEMQHLASVNRMLVDLDAAPNLVRQDFPYEPDINHRPHRALDQQPPAGCTPPPSGTTVRPLRRDRLGGLLHEYVQVA